MCMMERKNKKIITEVKIKFQSSTFHFPVVLIIRKRSYKLKLNKILEISTQCYLLEIHVINLVRQ